MTTIAVGRPSFDTATRWGQWWLNALVKKIAEASSMTVIDLYGNAARRVFYLGAMETAVYLSACGHGNDSLFTGQDREHVFWFGDPETARISVGKHFNFLSCKVGQKLAPWMATVGAVGVHAYTNIYGFYISTYPNDIAKYFFQGHHETDAQLLAGKTHGEAHTNCKAKYQEYIEDPNVPEYIKPQLLDDMNGKSFFGNANATITEAPPPPPETAIIKGRVTDQGTGEPIKGAYIHCETAIETTDSQGNYSLKVLAPAEYTVIAEHDDYYKQEKPPIVVEPDKVYSLNFQLKPIPVFTVKVNSEPIQGIPFHYPTGVVTPFELKIRPGKQCILNVHQKVKVNGKTYSFKKWDDGRARKWRIITVWSDMTIIAYYRLRGGKGK